MDKILILGCSYTTGSYTRYTKREYPLDIPINNYSWWYYVDYFKNKDVTIIACPGQGYWTWYQILLYLNENKILSNYNEIWIQETFSFRATLLSEWKLFANKLDRIHFKEDNFTLKVFYLDDEDYLFKYPFKDESINNQYKWQIPFYSKISESCAYYINELCKEKNIKGTVWSMYKPIMKNNHFKRLKNLYNVRTQFLEKQDNLLVDNSPGYHQTEEGNKYIGRLINSEMG